jgi:excisionase family DNA binding protein
MSAAMTRLHTQAEAAELLRLSERTLERLRVTGEGPRFVKAGRRVLYRDADLDAWVDARTKSSTSEQGL